MSAFQAISRANRQMQLDSWTRVVLDAQTLVHIYDENEEIEFLADVHDFLQSWLRSHNKGGFAILKDDETGCLTFLFKLSSEAVRFKLTWGGK